MCNEIDHCSNFGCLEFPHRSTLKFVQYYVEEFVLDCLHFVNEHFSCCYPDLVSISYGIHTT